MTYVIVYQLACGRIDQLELTASGIDSAEDRACWVLERRYSDTWRIIGVRTRSGLTLS